jgi:nicotinamide mononucleotide (NMN) deamidase PncC
MVQLVLKSLRRWLTCSKAAGTTGVGITGVAGPGGGTEDKPVGLVYIGLAEDAGTSSRRYLFPVYLIRNFSVNAALDGTSPHSMTRNSVSRPQSLLSSPPT